MKVLNQFLKTIKSIFMSTETTQVTTDTTVTTPVGTDSLKAVLVLGAQLESLIASDLADKKLSLTEIMGLVPYLLQLPTIIAQKDAIIEQAKSLSLDQVKDLVNSVKGSVTDTNVIDTIIDVLNFIVSAKAVYLRFASKKA